jgi:hypothetical protein
MDSEARDRLVTVPVDSIIAVVAGAVPLSPVTVLVGGKSGATMTIGQLVLRQPIPGWPAIRFTRETRTTNQRREIICCLAGGKEGGGLTEKCGQ